MDSPWGRLESDKSAISHMLLEILQDTLQQPQEDTALQNHIKSINRPLSNMKAQPCLP